MHINVIKVARIINLYINYSLNNCITYTYIHINKTKYTILIITNEIYNAKQLKNL